MKKRSVGRPKKGKTNRVHVNGRIEEHKLKQIKSTFKTVQTFLDCAVEASDDLVLKMKERLSPAKPFSYKDGDHLKDSVKNEKIMREKVEKS